MAEQQQQGEGEVDMSLRGASVREVLASRFTGKGKGRFVDVAVEKLASQGIEYVDELKDFTYAEVASWGVPALLAKALEEYLKPLDLSNDAPTAKRQKSDAEWVSIMLAQMKNFFTSMTSVNSQHCVGETIMKSSMWCTTLSEKELENYLGVPVMNADLLIEKVLTELNEPVGHTLAAWDTLALRGLNMYNAHAEKNGWKSLKADDLKNRNGECKELFVQLAISYLLVLVKDLCPGVEWFAIDTSVSGIPGHGMKPDISLCNVSHASLPEMVTMLELNPVHNLTNYASAVGQLKDRADALFSNQPGRSKVIMAYSTIDFLDLVVIENNPPQVRHSGALSLKFDKDSRGLRLLMRLLLTRSLNLGFIPIAPPFIPVTPNGAGVTVQDLVFIAKPKQAVEESDVDTDQPSPRGTKVYFCKYEHQGSIKEAVLKLGRVEKEVVNLRRVQRTDGVIRLLDTGHCSDGEYLITYPRGERLSLKMKAADIFTAISQIANTIKHLYNNHSMVHRDISIGNIIWVKEADRAYLIDFATAAETERIQAGDEITGTPIFMSIHVLAENKSNVSTDLESLMYVLMYIAVDGHLPWRKKNVGNNRHVSHKAVKYCTMKVDFQKFSERMTQDLDLKRGVENLRELFFVPEYRIDVSAEEFLQALNKTD